MRLIISMLALAAIAGPASVAAEVQAQPRAPTITTADFAALPLFRLPLLSPNGRRIAARTTVGGETRLAILDADRPESPPRMIRLGSGEVAAVKWAGNHRLLLTLRATEDFGDFELPFLRLIAVDVDSGHSRVVDKKSRGLYAGDVLYADPSGSWALVASQDDAFAYPSVKRADLATGDAVLVEKARDGVWDWYADDDGVVRAGVAYEGRRWTVWYREKPGEKLRRMSGKVAKDDDSAVDRIIFGRNNNSWILTNERTGRFGVYTYDLKTGAVGAPLFEHAEVDVDDVTYNAITGTVSAVEYHDDRPRTVWFEPESKALQTKLDRALPNSVNTVVDSSHDKKRVLVWSGGASDPGLFYLLDRTAAKMHPVIDPYPSIDPEQLAPVKAVRYQARDGLSIPAYLTLPRGRQARGLPLILLPHGGPFTRDKWDYDPLVQFLASRGYAVLQPQFRGSTGYGRQFVERGYGEWGRKMQDDLDDGVDWLARSGQIDPKRVCMVGASYGGYAALWAAIRNRERYRCAASWAGVSDVPAMLKYDRKLFSAARYFREWRTKVGGNGKADLAAVSPIRFPDRLKIPVFIGHGEQDDNVPPRQSREMVAALSKARANVTSVFYKDSGHDFGSSADLEDWLRRLEQFLAKNNPS